MKTNLSSPAGIDAPSPGRHRRGRGVCAVSAIAFVAASFCMASEAGAVGLPSTPGVTRAIPDVTGFTPDPTGLTPAVSGFPDLPFREGVNIYPSDQIR